MSLTVQQSNFETMVVLLVNANRALLFEIQIATLFDRWVWGVHSAHRHQGTALCCDSSAPKASYRVTFRP